MRDNLLLMTDSYKASHFLQLPPQTTQMYHYVESRGGEYPEVLFFGLQYALERYLAGTAVTEEDVAEAASLFKAHGEPFNYQGWMHIARDLGGKLPVRIRAVPEGLVVPTGHVLLDIENTDPAVPWLPGYLETMLLRAVWYPSTVATTSYFTRKTIEGFAGTVDDPSEVLFKLHDFGARGVSSHESAGIGGAAHLVNFRGTDTVEALLIARDYYDEEMAAFSVPASEHSTMTAWGRNNEADAYRHMLTAFQGSPIISVVSDSYDVWNALENIWGDRIREAVRLANLQGTTVVIRLDSGEHPPTVVRRALALLEDKFGATVNSRGYKVLNGVRVLQGDGINRQMIYEILSGITNDGYSMSNIGTFGMGGALLQHGNRDTLKWAMKASSMVAGGVRHDIFKEPVDAVWKRSKKGRLDLVKRRGHFQTVEYGASASLLGLVFEDGDVKRHQALAQIRELAWPAKQLAGVS